MTTKELIEIEKDNLTQVVLHHNGYMWNAYERSAMRLALNSSLKVTRRYVLAAEADIVKIGFPDSIKKERMKDYRLVSSSDKQEVYECLGDPLDEEQFQAWKQSFPLLELYDKPNIKAQCGFDVEKAILEFDFLNSSPMDCLHFLIDLKEKILCHSRE